MLDIAQRVQEDVMILELKGKLVIEKQSGVSLHKTFEAILDGGGRKILLDLKELTSVDSSGLGELVQCQKLAEQRKASLKLFNLSVKVRELLELTRLIELFELLSDEDAPISD